jgi:peptidase M15-like protein
VRQGRVAARASTTHGPWAPGHSPQHLQPQQILALQRTAGNAAVADLLAMQRCEETSGNTECRECGRSVQRAGDAGVADAGPAPAPAPTIAITRTGRTDQTFISTDHIGFSANVTGGAPTDAGVAAHPINWTVTPVSANAGNGNPHTAANQANFTFTPNPTHRLTTGSRTANDAIEYRVEAAAGTAKASVNLVQDETDIIRQEYVDFGAGPPARSDIVTPSIATYNTGNYTLIVDKGMDNARTGTETAFATLTQAAAPHPPAAPTDAGVAPDAGAGPDAGVAPVPVPAIGVSSGYRNPRRNVAAGSVLATGSQHVWGRALDLTVAGANATLWTRLRQAGQDAGNTVSICEIGPNQVACTATGVNHVHINF